MVDAAERKGRAKAKEMTKNQYEKLSDAADVATRPSRSSDCKTRVRPRRSARDESGSDANDANRKIARPSPSTDPERPTTLLSDVPEPWCPKCCATSLSDETAPNWPNPATSAAKNSATVTRSANPTTGAASPLSGKLHVFIHDDECFAMIRA